MSPDWTPLKPGLVAGGFYRDRSGRMWCCYKVDRDMPAHSRARCVHVESDRVEYFHLDGRYDAAGEREFCLVEKVK